MRKTLQLYFVKLIGDRRAELDCCRGFHTSARYIANIQSKK